MAAKMLRTRSILFTVLPLVFVSFARTEVADATHLDQGWRLWLDPKVAWQDDTLYLPEDVILTNLPLSSTVAGAKSCCWRCPDSWILVLAALPANFNR
jgi:hypothetical protein